MEKQDEKKNDLRDEGKSSKDNKRPEPDPVKLQKTRRIYEERKPKPKK